MTIDIEEARAHQREYAALLGRVQSGHSLIIEAMAQEIERLKSLVAGCRNAMVVSMKNGGRSDWSEMIAELDTAISIEQSTTEKPE